jgi:hypothetical protein
MRPNVQVLIAVMALGILAEACSSITPTKSPAAPSVSPAIPTPTARPTIAGPAWVQAAAERWVPGSAQWNALEHPDVPYRLGGSANGNANGITFTPNLARRWWDAWFANPVDRRSLSAGFQPGGLVLSVDEIKRVAELQSRALPLAPADYNPLGLPTVP